MNVRAGTLIIADEQTAGKGRQGRQWQSQKGKNLLFTVVTRPFSFFDKVRVLPFCCGVSTADGIEQETKSAGRVQMAQRFVNRRQKSLPEC